MTPAPGELPRRCSKCGVTITHAAWSAMPLVGHQHVPTDPDDPTPAGAAYTLELRNCTQARDFGGVPCHSTLAIRVLP